MKIKAALNSFWLTKIWHAVLKKRRLTAGAVLFCVGSVLVTHSIGFAQSQLPQISPQMSEPQQSETQALTGDIPLDLQVDINVPEKRDALAKKKSQPQPAAEPTEQEKTVLKSAKTVSYDGVWVVTQTESACAEKLNDFKIRISSKDIDTFIGLDVAGSVKEAGTFEMDAATTYWSIKFTGKLDVTSGRGVWIRKFSGQKNCSGAIQLTRVGN